MHTNEMKVPLYFHTKDEIPAEYLTLLQDTATFSELRDTMKRPSIQKAALRISTQNQMAEECLGPLCKLLEILS